MILTLEQPQHAGAIEHILDISFGPERFAKTVYKLREDVAPVDSLSLVALEDGAVQGTIRYWPILLGGSIPSLLLGPVAVLPLLRSQGLGAVLINESLSMAKAQGHQSVLLVGDAPYYTRFGFTRDLTLNLTLPGPVELDRFLGLELVPGALAEASGMVERVPMDDALHTMQELEAISA
jgi:predicted N-acetyltransferase YhbS